MDILVKNIDVELLKEQHRILWMIVDDAYISREEADDMNFLLDMIDEMIIEAEK
jgi:hypothetical protein